MKKYVLAVLLLVCFLISLPIAASDHESVEAESLMNFLQTPETTLFSFPEEITINPQGEVPVLLLASSETINFDVVQNNIILLEFIVDSGSNHKLYGDDYVLIPNTYLIAKDARIIPMMEGIADLFCFIQHSDYLLLL